MDWDPQICRICYTSSDEQTVELKENARLEEKKNWLYLFNSCTQLSATLDDCLPKILCKECSIRLMEAFELREKAVSSDRVFRRNLETNADEKNTRNKPIPDYYDEIHDDDGDGLVEYLEENEHTNEIVETIEVRNLIEFKETKTMNQNETGLESPVNLNDELMCDLRPKDDEHASDDEQMLVELLDSEYGETSLYDDCNICNSDQPSQEQNDMEENQDQVKCDDCGKLLKRSSLQSHRNRFHTNSKQFLCSSCPKTFATSTDLKVHKQTHNTDRQRSFTCHICPKTFYDRQTCEVHIQRHTGEKPFSCSNCPKRFFAKNALKTHIIVHNRQVGRFKCAYCFKTFASNSDLIVHVRFHTGDYPFKCAECGKRYAVKSHYNYHMAKHKGVMYKCTFCPKEFNNRSSLRCHAATHSIVTPFHCSICDKGMSSPFSLRRHMSAHKKVT